MDRVEVQRDADLCILDCVAQRAHSVAVRQQQVMANGGGDGLVLHARCVRPV